MTNELTDEMLANIRQKYLNVVETHRSANTTDEQYWQGRKDGNREIMALLPSVTTDYSALNKSSLGYRPPVGELFDRFVEDAVYFMAATVYELKTGRLDMRTKTGLRDTVELYDRLAADGVVPVIDDHCLFDQ